MEEKLILSISREKHMDHMVKMVPFIVFCYGIQSYVLYQIGSPQFSNVTLSVLGVFLALLVCGFVLYDTKHKVDFYDKVLVITFFGRKTTINYDLIFQVSISEPDQTFATLILQTERGKYSFYFIDEAEKIKKWLDEKTSENKKRPHQEAA